MLLSSTATSAGRAACKRSSPVLQGVSTISKQHSSMPFDDNKGAAKAPTASHTPSLSRSACKQHISFLQLATAFLLLLAQSTTAQHPWHEDPHRHPDHPPGESFRAYFGPHLHGPDLLPDGAQWLLFQEHWRVVGSHLASRNFTRALEDAAGVIYSQYSFHGIYAGSHRSHAAPVFLDGQPGTCADTTLSLNTVQHLLVMAPLIGGSLAKHN